MTKLSQELFKGRQLAAHMLALGMPQEVVLEATGEKRKKRVFLLWGMRH